MVAMGILTRRMDELLIPIVARLEGGGQNVSLGPWDVVMHHPIIPYDASFLRAKVKITNSSATGGGPVNFGIFGVEVGGASGSEPYLSEVITGIAHDTAIGTEYEMAPNSSAVGLVVPAGSSWMGYSVGVGLTGGNGTIQLSGWLQVRLESRMENL